MWEDDKKVGYHLRIALFYRENGSPRIEIPEDKIVDTLEKALKEKNGDIRQALNFIENSLRQKIRSR